ncbi:MAG: 50S ribosomal protein L35 [Aquificae bacterium]|jgi:large subunit ribosomal protein L35|nr:50S ribosomal protein L35 [Aquificota bacterium]
MPRVGGKVKTNRSLAKRIKLTKKGKIKRWKGGYSHYATRKEQKNKRQARKPIIMDKDHPRYKKLIKMIEPSL